MLAELSTGLGSLKAALEVTKTLAAASNQAAVNEVKITLQSHILSAQEALFSAHEAQLAAANRIAELERELASRDAWKVASARYELAAVDSGAFVYALRAEYLDGDAPHWLCPTCFGKGRSSILQSRGNEDPKTGRRGNTAPWVCDACRSVVTVSYTRNPAKHAAGMESEAT